MTTYQVTLEPLNESFECGEDETVLEAALRHGYNVVHGCREGRCTACRSFLAEGYVDLKPYSTFALSTSEEEEGFTLLCRAVPESDIVVELLDYDPEDYRLENPVIEAAGRVAAIEPLTHDISLLTLETDGDHFLFQAGQYVDLRVPGGEETRSYSMANLRGSDRLEFIVKRYPGGVFSGLLDGKLAVGDTLSFSGPYGNCVLKHQPSESGCLLIAGGSGMAPMLSLLREIVESDAPTRPVTFFYGGRALRDLFYLELIEELGSKLESFEFVPVLSQPDDADVWGGERGFIHEAVDRNLRRPSAASAAEQRIYMAGPQAMIDATVALLSQAHDVDADRIAYDTFG
jgi:propane monooxygenase reductase subunit